MAFNLTPNVHVERDATAVHCWIGGGEAFAEADRHGPFSWSIIGDPARVFPCLESLLPAHLHRPLPKKSAWKLTICLSVPITSR